MKTPRPAEFGPVLPLPSIEAFGAHIHRKLVACRSAGRRPVVMLMTADELGAEVARSEMLAALGGRLRSRVRSTDLVVQIGDCFGVYFEGDVAPHAMAILDRLRRALLEDVGLGHRTLRVRPRFGLAIHPGVPSSGIDLVNAASQAFEA